jgi:hypothetical protein
VFSAGNDLKMKFVVTNEIFNTFLRAARQRTVEAILFGSPVVRESDGEDESVILTWAWAVSGDETGSDSPTDKCDFGDFWSGPKIGNLQQSFKNVTRVLPGGWVVTGFIVSPEFDVRERALEFRDACFKWSPNCLFSVSYPFD